VRPALSGVKDYIRGCDGIHHLGQRTARNGDGDARQDGSSPQGAPDERAGQSGPRIPLGTRWEATAEPGVHCPDSRSGHIEPSSLKKQHSRTFLLVNAEAKKNKQPEVTPWVLYSFRHTFLTRLGESSCDTWTLARIGGHSTIAMSSRYAASRSAA